MTASEPRTPRDQESWAQPVDRLTTTAKSTGVDTVTGKRVAGPVQGFGQMWQKTFKVRLDDVAMDPEAVVAHWKAGFPTFWPKGAAFYAPLAGITPGEVALLEVAPIPGSPVKMSTGVMVLYADRESFTFMTPEGHALSAWITFSSFKEGGVTVAQAQALERTSDPFIELTYILGANKMNDRFWEQTLENLARSLGVAAPSVTSVKVCVDKRRQWRYVRNLRHSPAVSMPLSMLTAPLRWLRRRRSA
ncbi:MAG: hypothetical protein ABIQ17_01435 [Candidatus Limnocylindrales bacterium]